MFRCLLVFLLLAQTAQAGEDVDHHINQATLFMRKGWHDDAATELRAALASEAGQQRLEVYELAADVAWELQDIDWAIEMADGAAALATTPSQRAAAEQLAASYRQQFGFLTIDGPHPGMTSRLQLESTSLILNPELKTFSNQVALRLKDNTALPIRVGVPVGSWLVNGEEIVVSAGAEAAVKLPMKAVGSRGLSRLQVTHLEIAGGGAVLLGEGTENLITGPLLQLSITQPIGPVLVGLIGEFAPSSYTDTRNAIVQADPNTAFGGRIGRELYLSGSVAIRPSLFAQRGSLTGLSNADSEAWSEAIVTTSVGSELSMEYREAGRTTALGTGVKLAVDRTWATLPDDTPFSSTGLRLLTNLSLAF